MTKRPRLSDEDFSPGTDYAVTYIDGPMTPFRPLRATYVGKHSGQGAVFEVHDPDDPIDFPARVPWSHLAVHGEWNKAAHPSRGGRGQTWAELAAEQYKTVLRQRGLAERLTKIGIKRDPEPYTHKDRISNAVELSLTLTYDEIDLLLRRGGA